MPIYDHNGSAVSAIGKLYDYNGSANTQIGKVYDNNGTTNSLIYSAEETFVTSATNTFSIDADSAQTWLVRGIPAGTQFKINYIRYTQPIHTKMRIEAWVNNYTGTKIVDYNREVGYAPNQENLITNAIYTSTTPSNTIYIQFRGNAPSGAYNTRPTGTVYLSYTTY